MLAANDITLSFGQRVLFKDVNLKFLPGNCYGLIGANGAGKSTFLKVLAGEIEPNRGDVITDPNERIAVLQQDQFAFDAHTVLQTVIMGHKQLYDVQQARDAIYAKPDFSEEDGILAAELEATFAELNGYEAESEAATLLKGLGIEEALLDRHMRELEGTQKVRVLLAQAMFGNPDVLLLDEPTNQLDLDTIRWLEDFLFRFNNTVIVVSHDRHFLNNVCTHIADIDYGKIQLYVGNYEFWYESSQLAMEQRKNEKKKREDKIKELEEFVRRFSANVAKARQATSRKKLIDKLTMDELPASTRRFPFVGFDPERPCGKVVLRVENLCKSVDDQLVLNNFSLEVNQNDKIAFIGDNDLVKTTLFDILAGELKPDYGSYEWGTTITMSYFPKENSAYFDTDLNLVEWLRQYATVDDSETFLRGFLGRMLFSGEEALKNTRVLSGGEKVRCMLSRMMLSGANALMLDEPTNHLDLEAITALNKGLTKFPEVVLFASHDYEFVNTIANRIVEITPGGVIDRMMSLEAYLDDPSIAALRRELYHGEHALTL
ncbi:MAG: ATP-binding cassette domain-containing protein [Ardenticatenaceae bacterium]|nr:ATP-binding cassette domain-containing protein [Anaerolineales bacterium]MCB9007428.1 ATP-binding cassette domain-containing protein [Ardenticatenaceae bacterium]